MPETAPDIAPEALGPSEPRPPTFRLLFACLTIVGIGNSMLFAVLPPIAREAGMMDWSVSAIFTLSAVFWVVTSPIWGRVSDARGRKPMIVLGLTAYAVSTGGFTLVAWAGLAMHVHWITLFAGLAMTRLIFGALGSATNPAAQAYVADMTPAAHRTREIAAVTSAFAFGSAAGPALAAAMTAHVGLLAPLVATTLLAAAGALAARLFLPDVQATPIAKRSGPPGGVWRIAGMARVRPWLVAGLLLSAVTAVMFQQLSFYFMDRLGLAPRIAASSVALALALGAMAQIVAQIGLIPRLSLSPRGLVVSGAAVTALGAAATVWGDSFVMLALAQILVGIGFGLARPGFTGGASLAVGPDQQGSVAGLVVAANGAGFIVAPLFGAGTYAWLGPQAPFALCGLALAGLAVWGLFSPGLKVAGRMTESPPEQPGV